MAHSHHMHREHQVSHRRVGEILKGEPPSQKRHATGNAFSAVTSRSAAQAHDGRIAGSSKPGRFARGGKVKGGATTNIAIITPGAKAGSPAGPLPGGPPAGVAPPMPGGPPPSPMGGPPLGGPPGMPPGMPVRARGGKVDGESTVAGIKKWGKRAADNSYYTGGAITGVGREEKAAKKKR